MKKVLSPLLVVVDILMLPFVYLAAATLWLVRRAGVHRMPLCKMALLHVGVFPVRRHYYEPLFDHKDLPKDLNKARSLPGIDWNVEGQLTLLNSFNAGDEIADIDQAKQDELAFCIDNANFLSGDAEYLYNLIRTKKPRKIVEIGSGHSTLMAIRAVKKNAEEDPSYQCEHICVEPYEMPWLEKTGIKVIREKVEDVDKNLFLELGENDLLFIDSSHMIRPQGDVLCEFLEILPILKPGVIVHIHDIFSPMDYPEEWIKGEVRFWNEQYLLEAFLSHNPNWKIIGAVNFLHRNHYQQLKEKCIFLTPERNPGSFYIQKVA
jgi:predicted O-methyltransferase YrrM